MNIPALKTDSDEVRRALSLLATGMPVEVRIFGACRYPKAIMSGYYDDHEKLVADVSDRNISTRATAVYFTLNQLNPELLARRYNRMAEVAEGDTTNDSHIIRRRSFMIDCDPVRLAKISSTDDQHQAAITRSDKVADYLTKGLGWPEGAIVRCDSGNGAHIIVGVDLPNDETSKMLVEGVLKSLAAKFDDDKVKIDTTVTNAARICKLPGTPVRKGDNVPTHPHRMSRIRQSPGVLEVVSVQDLESLAALSEVVMPKQNTRTPGNKTVAGNDADDAFDMEAFIKRLGLTTGGPTPYKGGTKWQMTCPFNPDHTKPDAMLSLTGDGKPGFYCSHNSCKGKNFTELRDRLEPNWRGVRNKKLEEQTKNSKNGGFSGSVGSDTDTRPTFDKPLGSLEIDLLPVPDLSEGMIPEPLRDWVSDIAQRGCFPLEFVFAPVIVCLSAVVGRRMAIRPKRYDDWIVVPNLWGAVIGPPGIQKTPAVSEAMRPLVRLEMEARKAYESAVENHEIMQAVSKAKSEGAKERLKLAAKKEGANDETLRLLAIDAMRGDSCESPVWRRYTVNDTTVEKLAELLKENPEGLLLFRDELTGFLKTLERQGHEADRAFYLEAWTGVGKHIDDRISRGTTVVEGACMSIFGTIQPGPMASYLRGSSSGEEADGFAPRLQILVYPDPPRTFKNIDRYPNTAAKEKAFITFKRLAELNPTEYRATIPVEDEKGIPCLNFSEEAQEFFDSWRTVLEMRLREGKDTNLMLTHLAKYRSLMPSLALLFHLLDNVAGPVSLQAAEMSVRWCEFLEAHARRVYQSVMDGNPEAAQLLAGRIKQSLGNPFTPREVMQKGWSGLSTLEDVERAIGLLEEKGWVQTIEVPPGPKGGRPSRQVWINPELRTDGNKNNPISMGAGTYRTYTTPDEDQPEDEGDDI